MTTWHPCNFSTETFTTLDLNKSHIFAILNVHTILLCKWFSWTPTTLILDSVQRRRGSGAARWNDVCLARVFRDLTPFASAVQTHNQQPYLAKAKALPPPIPYLHSRHAIPLCTLSTSLYKVHLPDSPLLTSLSKA